MLKKIVLIADEESEMLESLSMDLKKDFFVLKVPSGRDALEVMKTWQVDCLVAGCKMEEMDALKLVKKVRKAGYPINIIISMENDDQFHKDHIIDLEVGAFVKKPYSHEAMAEMIRSVTGHTKKI